MRPLHALLLVVALAAVLVAALFFVRADSTSGHVAPALVEKGSADPAAAEHVAPSALVTPETDAAGQARTAESVHLDRGAPAAKAKVDARSSSAVRGRVVDANGRPVAGARVYAAASGGFPGLAIDEYETEGFSPFPRVDGTTDDTGRFALEPKAQGAVRLAVRAAGFAPLDVEKPIAATSPDVGDLQLETGAVLTGRVVDAAGRGVAGAELHRQRASQGGSMMVFAGGGGPLLAKSDERGEFRIDQLAVGPWSLLVTSEAHPDKTESGETDRAGQVVANLQIALEDGFEIQGRVNGAPGDALKDLWVRAMPIKSAEANEPGDLGVFGLGQLRRAKVASDGAFTLRGLRKGPGYRLTARSGERRMMGGSRSTSVEAKAGDRGVEIAYRPETALLFQVVDAASGAPLVDMSVQAGFRFPMPLLDEQMKPVKSFPDGRVRFANFPQGGDGENASLIIEAQGYTRFEKKDLKVQIGQDNDLGVIRLERSALVHVTVLEDSTGAPIANAQVSLNEVTPDGGVRGMRFTFGAGGDDDEDGDIPQGSAHRGKTDPQGQVAISSLPGKPATISVRQKDHAPWKSETIELPLAGDFTRVVRLQSGGTVVVHVVDAAGAPVAGIRVDHQEPTEASRPILMGGPNENASDAEGQVVFAHLLAGKHQFRVRKNGGGGIAFAGGNMVVSRAIRGGSPDEDSGDWSAVDVAEGATQDLKLAAPLQGVLTGRITESGKPLAGATVALHAKDGDEIEMPFMEDGVKGETNAKGEYTIEKVEAGEYRVTVTHPTRTMPWEGEKKVRDGANQFNADVPVAIVEGRVNGEDGKPVAGVRIHAERKASDAKPQRRVSMVMVMDSGDGASTFFGGPAGGGSVNTDSDGRYRLRGVTPDVELTIIASGKEYQREDSDAVKVAPDQVKSGVDFVVKKGATVEVSVRRATGAAPGACLVHARVDGEEDGDVKTEMTSPEGKARFTGLKPGRWKLSCNALGGNPGDGATIPDQSIDVKVGPAQTVTFDMP